MLVFFFLAVGASYLGNTYLVIVLVIWSFTFPHFVVLRFSGYPLAAGVGMRYAVVALPGNMNCYLQSPENVCYRLLFYG